LKEETKIYIHIDLNQRREGALNSMLTFGETRKGRTQMVRKKWPRT
jgi:hypothetical protein